MKDAVKDLWREIKMSKTGLPFHRSLELQLLTFTEEFTNPGPASGRVCMEQSLAESTGSLFGCFGGFVLIRFVFPVFKLHYSKT